MFLFGWSVLTTCSSEFPATPDTESILKWFSHQAGGSPVGEAVLCETKICWNDLALPKMHPNPYPQSASSEFHLPSQSLKESGRKETGSRDNKFLGVHGCWDPFSQLWGDFWAAFQQFSGLHIYYTLSCRLGVLGWWMELKKQQMIHFSWKEKIGNMGSCPESHWKLRGEGSYLGSFRCPAYQHVRSSVVMKLKFLK